MSIIKTKRGDTIVEVIFAIAIFSLIAVISVGLMNAGVSTAQTSLETTMVRNEIDAQAEAIRFIQNSYAADREKVKTEQKYRNLWQKIVEYAEKNKDADIPNLTVAISCQKDIYESGILKNTFVINTRALSPDVAIENVFIAYEKQPKRFTEAPLHSRLVFTNSSGEASDDIFTENGTTLSRAEGLYVFAVAENYQDKYNNEGITSSTVATFYDFYIRACWYAPGQSTPSTIGTVIRLYNPDIIEGSI